VCVCKEMKSKDTVATVFAIDDVEVRLSLFHRVSRLRGTGSVGDSVGEGQ